MKKQVYIEIVSTQVGADGQKEILSSSVEGNFYEKDGKKYVGTLAGADADHFTVTVTVKVKPEGAKRPKLEEQELTFAYDEIKYTKYLISFR